MSLPPLLAVVFLIPVVILGARAVLSSLTPALAVIDLGCALAVLALTVATAVSAFARRAGGTHGLKPPVPGPPCPACPGLLRERVRRALALTVAVGRAGAPSTCLGWPAWVRAAALVRSYGAVAVVQYAAAAAATLFVAAVVVTAWRSRTTPAGVPPAATVAAVLFFSGVLTGELAAARGFPMLLLGLRVALRLRSVGRARRHVGAFRSAPGCAPPGEARGGRGSWT